MFRLFRLDMATGGEYRDKCDEPFPDLSCRREGRKKSKAQKNQKTQGPFGGGQRWARWRQNKGFFYFFLEIEEIMAIFAREKRLIILNCYLYVFERRIDI